MKNSWALPYSAVTPKNVYLNRRNFLATAAGAAAALALPEAADAGTKLTAAKTPYGADEKQTPYNITTSYNNYYEFGTDKGDPAKNAGKLKTSPWSVKVDGLVDKPATFDMDQIMKIAPLEERIYRHR